MNTFRIALKSLLLLGALLTTPEARGAVDPLPDRDSRAANAADLNTARSFPVITNQVAWKRHAEELREHVLVSCGLWPMPERGPVQFRVFDKIERDGYSIEKVVIKTWPGFYLGGNLYRPKGKGSGPFPAILNPHGHWKNGRLADEETGSIAARCITFARQGMIAFTYDMVGYNDTVQVPHSYASDPTNQLWSVSLMGLQTWNSVRALDFLVALPDSDPKRLACTGESGGGTQTFMLGAIDDRLAVQAPIVMVSHTMQGGCLCENAPGLRVKHSNMEIAAIPAPRPQILVAASGDWTKSTPWVEGPAIESIYRLFGAPNRFSHARFDFPHNYNKTSRETVYGWFGQWLLNQPAAARVSEPPYKKEPDQELRVWKNNSLPDDALNEAGLSSSWVNYAKGRLAALRPSNKESLLTLKSNLFPAWRHALQLDSDSEKIVVEVSRKVDHGSFIQTTLAIGRPGHGDRLDATLFEPQRKLAKSTVIIPGTKGQAAYMDNLGIPLGVAHACLDEGLTVLLVDVFQTGLIRSQTAKLRGDQLRNYFTVYNRTDLQERIQDLATTCRAARQLTPGNLAVLCGEGAAGWWTMLAAPVADAVVSEASGLNPEDDRSLLAPDFFAPGLNRFGSFAGALSLAAPKPAFIHAKHQKLDLSWPADARRVSDSSRSFVFQDDKAGHGSIAAWIRSISPN